MHPLIPYFEPFSIPISGNIGIHGFGILIAIGFMMGVQHALRKVERDGLNGELINRMVGWVVGGIFIGGHLGHALFYEPKEYFNDPIRFLYVWEGLSSTGGFIACILIGVYFFGKEGKRIGKINRKRKKKGAPLLPRMQVLAYADVCAYGFTMAWIFARLGCFSAHDHPGLVTEFWLGVYGICTDQPITVACHDLGLYESMWAMAITPIFYLLDKKPRFPGFFAALLLMAYGPTRLLLDSMRAPGLDTRYFGLTPAQYGAMVFFSLGVYIFMRQRNKPPLRTTLPPDGTMGTIGIDPVAEKGAAS